MLKLHNQDPQTSPQAGGMTSQAKIQPQKNNSLGTALTNGDPRLVPRRFPVEVEQYEGFDEIEMGIMKDAWHAAVQSCARAGTADPKKNFWDVFRLRLKISLSREKADNRKAPNPHKAAKRLLKMYGRAERRALKGVYQDDPVVPTKPSEETTQAPVGLLLEPPSTTVPKADPISENVGLTLSGDLEETGSADASTTGIADNRNIQVRTKDVEDLERDILNSHQDVWQAASTRRVLSSRRITKRSVHARRPSKLSMDSARELTKPTTMNAKPFVKFDFFESETDKFMANITRSDSEAPDIASYSKRPPV
jgi:hypothetical protein